MDLWCIFHDALCLQRPCPPIIWIHHDFNCHINERENPKTCLTIHKGSISHHIMPLVINSFEGRYTHMHASIFTLWTRAISRNQSCASQIIAVYLQNCLIKVYSLCYGLSFIKSKKKDVGRLSQLLITLHKKQQCEHNYQTCPCVTGIMMLLCVHHIVKFKIARLCV